MQLRAFFLSCLLPLVVGQCQAPESALGCSAEDSFLQVRARQSQEASQDPIERAFQNVELLASKQTMKNDGFWSCITGKIRKTCPDERPTFWFTLLDPKMPQKLLHRSGPFGLLARTATWWEHVPAGGNLHWQDANTCGNVGLSNPKFASHQAFRDAVLGILREGAQYKRECPAAPTQKCPPWPEYSCGVTEGMKYQVMPVERAWVDHMELRAIVGNLVQGRPWDIKKDKWDDAKVIYKWQDQKGPWTGKQGWPRDPFVAGFYDFYDQPIGFKPPEGRFLGRAGEHEVTDKDYLNLCCTLLMSSSSKDEYATKLATYPLYFLWFTKLEKDDKSFSNSVGKKPEWAFLKKSNVNMSCSVDTCNRQTPPPPSSSSNCDAPVKVTLTGKTGPDRRVAACDAETARKELTERLKAEKKLQDGEECVLNCDGSQRTTEKCCCEFFQDGTETANPKFKTDRQPGIPALMQGQTRTSENQTETELRFELRIESGMDKDLVAATDSVGWGSAADRDGFLSQLHDKGVFKASQLSSLKEEDLSLPNDQLVRSRFHEVQAQQEATRLGAGANQAEIEARRQQLRQEVSQDLDRTQNLLNSALADAQNAVQQGSDALQSKAKEALQKAKAELAKVQTRAIDLDTTQGNNRLQALMNSGGFVNGRKLPLTALVAYAGIMRGVRIGGDEDDMSPSSHSQVVQWTPESASLTDQELYSAIAIHPESNSQEVNIETETAKDSVAADKRFSALGRSAFAQSGSNIAVSAGADAGWWGAKAGGGMNRRKSNGNAAEEEQKEEARRSVQTKSLYKTRYYLEPRLRIQLKASMLTPTSEFEEVIAELQERVCRTKHEDAPDKANNSDNADHCRKAASSKPTPPAPSIRGQRVLQVVFLVWNISHFDLVDLSPDVGGAVQARVESVIRKHCGLQQSRAEISIDVQLSKPDRSRGMDVVQHILDRADATEVLATIKLGNASAFSEAAANLKWAESHGFLEMDCLRAVKYTPHIDSAVVSGDINSIGIDAHSRPLAVVETTIPKTQDPEDEKVEGTPTETPSGELQLAMTGGPSLRSKPEVSESHRLQPVQTLRIHGPPSTPPKGSWERCACEAVGHWNHPGCTLSRNCACDGPVRYGFGDRWVTQTVSGSIECLSPNFEEDPYPNQGKECQCFKPDAVPAPTPPPSTTTPSTPAPSAPAPSAPAPSAPAPSTPPKSSERLQGDIESLLFRFGTHVCPQVVLGGWWKLAASYQSTEKHTEVDKSNVLSMAIEKTTVSAAQAHAEGSYGVAAGSAAGGTDNAEKVTETTNSGEREINKDAYKDANIEVTQEWRGGASGTSPADWRRSLDESFNSNWRVIDREIDNCVGVWTWVDDEELRSLICEHWLELYHASLGIPNVTEEDRSTVCHRDDGFRRMQSSMQIFEKQSCSKKGCLATATCPSGYQLMDCTGGASGLGLAITRTSCSLEAQYDFGATVEAACFRTDQPAHVQSQSFKEGWKYSGWVGDTWVGDAFHPVACPVGFSARLCTFRCDSEKEECIAPAAQPRSDGSCPSRCNEEWEQPVPDGLWCRGWTVFALCYPNDYQMTSGQISTYDHPLE